MKKMMLIPGLSLAILLVACNGSDSNNNDTDTLNRTDTDTASLVRNDTTGGLFNNDEDFYTKAASGGMMEVRLGQLAKTNASSKEVKDFAAMMVKDHSNANAELKGIATKNNITLPTTMTDDHQKHVDDLSEKTGAEFDRDYMSMMVDDHEDDIDLFEDCAKSDKQNAEVKAFASKTLPTLRKHLDAAKAIKDKLK